jgi:hypothetical protein
MRGNSQPGALPTQTESSAAPAPAEPSLENNPTDEPKLT